MAYLIYDISNGVSWTANLYPSITLHLSSISLDYHANYLPKCVHLLLYGENYILHNVLHCNLLQAMKQFSVSAKCVLHQHQHNRRKSLLRPLIDIIVIDRFVCRM